jgi:hypothetical protein
MVYVLVCYFSIFLNKYLSIQYLGLYGKYFVVCVGDLLILLLMHRFLYDMR